MKDGFRGRSAVAAVLTLLAVVLPALSAGASIDDPARAGEVERIAAAITATAGDRPGPDALWLASLAGDDPAHDAVRERLAVARLAAVAAVLAMSALTWLCVAVVRGRMAALLACLLLALAPPIARDGCVLRGELACAVFAGLGVLLLALLPARARRARRPGVHGAAVLLALHSVAAGTAFGIAVASAPAFGAWLFVPAVVMLAAVIEDGAALVRVLRRFRGLVLPFRAFALRLAPYVSVTFVALAVTALVLDRSPAVPPAEGLAPLTGDPLLGRLLWWSAALLGAGRLLLRLCVVATRRVDATLVLATSCAVPLLHRLARGDVLDALPAAPALAVLVAECLGLVVFVAAARLAGFRSRARSAVG